MNSLSFICFHLLLVSKLAVSGEIDLEIGAIFKPEEEEHLRLAFQYAYTKVPHYVNMTWTAGKTVKELPKQDYYSATRLYCDLIDHNKAGVIFAGTDSDINTLFHEMGEPMDSLFFEIPPSNHDYWGNQVYMFPERELIQANIDLIEYWKWRKLSIVYHEENGLTRLKQLMMSAALESIKINIVKLEGTNYLKAAEELLKIEEKCDFKDLKNPCKENDAFGVLVDLKTAHVHPFLLADILEIDLSMFSHNHARIVGFELLNRSTSLSIPDFNNHVKEKWKLLYPNRPYFPMTEAILMFDAVYAFAHAFLNFSANHDYTNSAQCHSFEPTARVAGQATHGNSLFGYIETSNLWGFSGDLRTQGGRRQFVKFSIHQQGYDGNMSDIGAWESAEGPHPPDQSQIKINETTTKIPDLNQRINVTATVKPHFRVTTKLERPYVTKKNSSGKTVYEGFCIDLLDKLATDLNFDYTIHEVKDNAHGKLNGTWNGMIGEILNDEADMALAALTVNFQRAQVVDFTKPFLSLGISILFRIPGPQQPSLFSFLNPLSRDIWIYILLAIVVVTVMMYIIGRISPYEWNPVKPVCHGDCLSRQMSLYTTSLPLRDFKPPDFKTDSPAVISRDFAATTPGYYSVPPIISSDIRCTALKSRAIAHDLNHLKDLKRMSEPVVGLTHYPAPPPPPQVELHNNYSFTSTIWYVGSTLLKGGCDFGPRAVSTRLLGGVWWVFTLVLVSAYTANLAAVLTVDRRFIPIKSLEDLANQTEIPYGLVDGGSTMTFFNESRIDTHLKMWEFMTSQKNVFMKDNQAGVQKVLHENYAFLMESTSLEFEVQQNCENLTQIGGVLGTRGYGIALKKKSEWTDKISQKILHYGEEQKIEIAKTKWWKTKFAGCSGGGGKTALKNNQIELTMENVAGLFVLLLGGIFLAIVSVIAEFCIKSREKASLDKRSLCNEMGQEFCFAVRLNNSKKKHRMERRCSECECTTSHPSNLHRAESQLEDGLINNQASSPKRSPAVAEERIHLPKAGILHRNGSRNGNYTHFEQPTPQQRRPNVP